MWNLGRDRDLDRDLDLDLDLARSESPPLDCASSPSSLSCLFPPHTRAPHLASPTVSSRHHSHHCDYSRHWPPTPTRASASALRQLLTYAPLLAQASRTTANTHIASRRTLITSSQWRTEFPVSIKVRRLDFCSCEARACHWRCLELSRCSNDTWKMVQDSKC